MPKPQAVAIRFSEAIEHLRRRLNLTSEEWRAIWVEAGGVAAEAASRETSQMHRDVLKLVLAAVEEGTTLEQFREAYAQLVAEHESESALFTGGARAQLAFRLHTMEAYAAGRWEQAERLAALNPEVRYYWRYITVGDHRVRPQHREWQGIILPVDHWFWRTHFPPNGFNCRCHPQLLTDRYMGRRGWTVTPDTDPRLSIPPDPGFEGNVGLAGSRLARLRRLPAIVPAI